jgi:serine/threonine protein kinase
MAYLIAAGKTIPLTKEAILGRNQAAGIPVGATEASRQHARGWPQEGGWWVEDLHSANGTLVNDRRMLAGPVRLADGDRIAIGEMVLVYRDGKPLPATPAKTATEHLAAGSRVGAYTIESPLGDGVATSIYKAGFPGGQVALHVVDPALVAGDEGFAKRFLGDIELAANVRHPGAVRIHRAGGIGRTAWYSTDILGGENLAHRMGAPFAPALALDIAISLCEVLIPYSEVGLVHGDLKPRSLRLAGERAVHLMDIGLIGLNDAERQRAQARGTTRQAYYLCPQQARRGDCNARSDLYSIGCMLVQMLTGRPPFLGPDFAAILVAHETEPVPRLAGPLGLPAMLDEVLGDLLHKEQFFRYDTTAMALARLREVRALLR